jgi:uridylate kinase
LSIGEVTAKPLYERVVIKISGESLGGAGMLDPIRFIPVAQMIASVSSMGVAATIVVGGGNIFRGARAAEFGLDRAQADLVGMASTIPNVLLLEGLLRGLGVQVAVFSRGPAEGVGSIYRRDDVLACLRGGAVALLAGGLGISGISTDVTAVHAAIDTDAPAVIMSKHGVEGVCTEDPKLNPAAAVIPVLTAAEALEWQLRVMDATAFTLARDHKKHIHVIPATETYGPRYVLEGKEIGSTILPG